MSASDPTVASGGARPGLEAARAVATMIVVFGHAALSYLETPIGWAVRDGSRWLGVDFGVWLCRQVVMPAFFVLSGMAAAASLARGTGPFVRQRLRRIALPLLLLLVPMSLVIDALWDWGRALVPREDATAGIPALRSSGLPIHLGHLWYLYYLLVLSAALLGLRALVGPARRVRLAAAARRVAEWPPAPLLLAVPGAACLAIAGTLQVDTPLGFAVDPVIAAYYATFFAVGVGAYGTRWPATCARHVLGYAVGAAALTAATVPALLASRTEADAPLYAQLTAAASSWLLVCALFGATRRWCPDPGRLLATVARASYVTYVAHLPIVVLLQIAMSQLAAPAPLEYAVIAAIGLGLPVAVSGAIAAKMRVRR